MMAIYAEDVQGVETLDDFIKLLENRETNGYGVIYILAESLLALAKANKKEIEALRAQIEAIK